jgi:hypothetical protein
LETTVGPAPLVASHLVSERVAGMIMQEYVARIAIQAAEVTNTLASFGRLHDKAKVDRITLIASSRLADRKVNLLAS